ncbi:MAG: coproporphyrinogen III oxidase, partial [Chitinophagaceae bacterium]|nr:coproporphyrinogen III oxidase [Chitinophagaceae bacterium]
MPNTHTKTSMRNRWIDYIHGLQDTICNALETEDGNGTFFEDRWERA